MSEHTYKIVKEATDPKESVIEKSNIKVEFTIYELEAENRTIEKYLKEFGAQKLLADAKITNIEDNHPWVKDLTEEQLFTAHMYQENQAMSRVMQKKIDEYEKAQIDSAEELKDIYSQIGVAFPINEEKENGKTNTADSQAQG
jgi:hypothetical protein